MSPSGLSLRSYLHCAVPRRFRNGCSVTATCDISQLDDFSWPSPDWFDVSDISDRISKVCEGGEKAIVVGNGNIFETSWYMRGFEKMFEDLALQPELANEIMCRVTNFY